MHQAMAEIFYVAKVCLYGLISVNMLIMFGMAIVYLLAGDPDADYQHNS